MDKATAKKQITDILVDLTIRGVISGLDVSRFEMTGEMNPGVQREVEEVLHRMKGQSPTYVFVDASTITDAATVEISGDPIEGTNVTLKKEPTKLPTHLMRPDAPWNF